MDYIWICPTSKCKSTESDSSTLYHKPTEVDSNAPLLKSASCKFLQIKYKSHVTVRNEVATVVSYKVSICIVSGIVIKIKTWNM